MHVRTRDGNSLHFYFHAQVWAVVNPPFADQNADVRCQRRRRPQTEVNSTEDGKASAAFLLMIGTLVNGLMLVMPDAGQPEHT